jgi:O-antigen/teichoic acid export membrane protein
MSELRKSLLISFFNKYSILAITIISSMIIARLLTPEEIGVFSVGASLIGVAHTLRDFGVSNYLVQVKEISAGKIRSAFTVAVLMAWSIAGLLFLTRHMIADFYHQPALDTIILILFLNFLILPFSSVTIALLKREMKFALIYKVTVLAALIQAITVITLVWLGYGSYSLAWGGVANVFTTAVLLQIAHPNFSNFKPSFLAIKPIISFGGQLSISSLANEMGSNAPDLIIGKIIGFSSAGIYSRAMGFVSIVEKSFTDAIYPVLLPFFSKENRENRDIKSLFLTITNYYLSITLPLLGLIAILAYPMVRLLYGSQWDNAVPIAQTLCLAMAFKSLNFLMGAAILSLGRAKQLMTAQLMYQLIRVAAVMYGALHSLSMIATSIVVAEFIGFFIFFSKIKVINVGLRDMLRPVIKNTFICLWVVIPSFIIYFISINYESLILIDPLSIVDKHTFVPVFVSELKNLYLITLTSIMAFIVWLLLISKLQQDLWKALLNMPFISYFNLVMKKLLKFNVRYGE